MADAPAEPRDDWCPIGAYNAHTWNHDGTECIWCGPNRLAAKPGEWVPVGDHLAWKAATADDR